VNLSKCSPRTADPKSKLPMFMQNKDGTRFGIETYGKKSLELNLYSQRGFCASSNYNGFLAREARKKLIKKKKIPEEDWESLEQLYKGTKADLKMWLPKSYGK
jgi:hypothetical protein